MPLIQPFDMMQALKAGMLGRQARIADEEYQAKREQAKADAERERQFGGLIREYHAGMGAPRGVAEQFGVQPVQQPALQGPQTVEQAFDATFSGAPATPSPAPAATPALQSPPRPAPRSQDEIMREMVLLDPKRAGEMFGVIKQMDEVQLKQLETRNNFMGAAARFIMQTPDPQERLRRFQIAAPQLLEVGFTPEQLDGIDNDLSDQRLQFYQATAIDYDKMIDNELAEREFQMGKTVPVTAGGNVALVKPNGDARWIIGGGPGASAPAIPAAAIEHLRLNPSLRGAFDEKYGAGASASILDKGGQTGAPSGTFRPVGVPGETITSTRRSKARNRSVGGVANSYHLSGRARDSIPPAGMSMSAYHAQLARLNPDLDVINEGDHVHMEPRA